MCWYMYQLSTLWGVRKTHTRPATLSEMNWLSSAVANASASHRRWATADRRQCRRYVQRALGPNVKKPPKMRFKKIVKLTCYTYVSNSLTNFEHVVQVITGNGSYLNLQILHGKTRETSLSELIFGGFQTFGTFVQRTQLLLCGFWTIFSRKSKYSENRCIGSVHEGKKLYSNVIIMMKGVPPVQRTQLLLYGFRTIFSRKSKYSGMYQFMKERSCIQLSWLRWKIFSKTPLPSGSV